MFYKKAALQFFFKIAGFHPATLFKKTLVQLFSCKFFELVKKTNFVEHLQAAASGGYDTNIHKHHIGKNLWSHDRLLSKY